MGNPLTAFSKYLLRIVEGTSERAAFKMVAAGSEVNLYFGKTRKISVNVAET